MDLPVRSVGTPLAKGHRGLILPSSIEVMGFSDVGSPHAYRQTYSSLRPEPLDLRKAVLLWDAIHLPEEMMPMYERDPAIQFLQKSGIVRQYSGPSEDQIASRFGGNLAFVSQQGTKPIYDQLRLNLFTVLEKQEPGQWAMGRGIQSPDIPDEERTAGRCALVNLTNMLPIPGGQVDLEEVLEFKRRRSAELAAIRIHIGDIYQKIAVGDIDEMVRNNYLANFERSICDYQDVIKESRMKVVGSDLLANFNIAGPVMTALTALIDPTGVIPIALLTLGGAMEIKPFSGLKRRKTNEAFEYVGQYHREITWHQ